MCVFFSIKTVDRRTAVDGWTVVDGRTAVDGWTDGQLTDGRLADGRVTDGRVYGRID